MHLCVDGVGWEGAVWDGPARYAITIWGRYWYWREEKRGEVQHSNTNTIDACECTREMRGSVVSCSIVCAVHCYAGPDPRT